jgi:hypothetical protein
VEDGQFTKAFEIDGTFYGIDAHGPANVVAVGNSASGPPIAYHWNGIDWTILDFGLPGLPEPLRIRDVWTGYDEIVIVGHDGVTSYALQGK